MIAKLEPQQEYSIHRAIRDLSGAHPALIRERYHRIHPVLRLLLHPRDILERNRTWPGIKPRGKEATRYLTLTWARQAGKIIRRYAAQHVEDADELWLLCRAYFRYGPIGLVDALASELPPLIPGHYPLTLWAGPHFTETYDLVERALGFDIETSPTKNRTFAHSPDHGYVVPESTCTYVSGEAVASGISESLTTTAS